MSSSVPGELVDGPLPGNLADNTFARIIDSLLRADASLASPRSPLACTQLLFLRFVAAACERRSLGIAGPFEA